MTARKDEPGRALEGLRAWALEAEAAATIARSLVGTPFIPDSLKRWHLDERGKPGRLDVEATVATVTAALLTGSELGFKPMASLRNIDVVRGVPALRALGFRGLVQGYGHTVTVVESTGTRAVVTGVRAGGGEVMQSVWTIDRARQAKLYPGADDGAWKKQTQAMLVARATAEVCRWVAADALLGLPYIAEELDGASAPLPADQDGQEPPPAPKQRRRRVAAVMPALPSAAPRDDADDDGEHDEGMISVGKNRRLHALLREKGFTAKDEALELISALAGRPVTATVSLTDAEGDAVIDALAGLSAREEEPPDDADD